MESGKSFTKVKEKKSIRSLLTSTTKFRLIKTKNGKEMGSSFAIEEDKGKNQFSEFEKLERKLEKSKMKAVSRGFNQTFYNKIGKRIEDKPISFYKFGLRDDEKLKYRNIFKDIFHVDPKKLGGTCSVGEMWSNKNSLKFLKENRMFFNKQALIAQFQDMDKDLKRKKKLEIKNKEKQEVKRYKCVLQERKKSMHSENIKRFSGNPQIACGELFEEINSLYFKKKKKSRSRALMRSLEIKSDELSYIEEKFKEKMILV